MRELSLTDFVRKTIASLQAANPEGFELSEVIDFEVKLEVNHEENEEPTLNIAQNSSKTDSKVYQKVTFSYVNQSKQEQNSVSSARSAAQMINVVSGAVIKQVSNFMAAVDPTPKVNAQPQLASSAVTDTLVDGNTEERTAEEPRPDSE